MSIRTKVIRELEARPSSLNDLKKKLGNDRKVRQCVGELLAEGKIGAGGEIQLTDALDAVLQEEEMYALVIDPADGFDTGTVESWLETNNILWQRRMAK